MDKGPRIDVGRTAELYAWGDHQILKLYRASMPWESVQHEASIGHIVADAGVHAPAIGETVEVDGRLGIIQLFRIGVLPDDTPWVQRVMTPLFRRAFLVAYLKSYRTLRSLSETEIETWLLILAAARLNERIDAEKTQLHRLANSKD